MAIQEKPKSKLPDKIGRAPDSELQKKLKAQSVIKPPKKDKKTGKSKQATYAEVESRIAVIVSLRMQGYILREIKAKAAALNWGVTMRQIEGYYKEAKSRIGEIIRTQEEDIVETSLERLNDLYRSCVGTKNYSVALGAVKLINELKAIGSNTPESITIKWRGESDPVL